MEAWVDSSCAPLIEEVLKDKMGVVWASDEPNGTPFQAIVYIIVVTLSVTNSIWRSLQGLTCCKIRSREHVLREFDVDMCKLRWKPSHWCHWVLVHSVQVRVSVEFA